jgi:hypothetical protein
MTTTSGALWSIASQSLSKFTTFSTSEKHTDDTGNTRPSIVYSKQVHNLVYAAEIASPISSSTTIAYLCDEVADAYSIPDTVYYVSGRLVNASIQYHNTSSATVVAIDGSTFQVDIGMFSFF